MRHALWRLTACLVVGATAAAAQQAPPSTDIYLLDLKVSEGRVQIGPPHNITDRDGYDNQPCFAPDGKSLLYNSHRDGQNDVYLYSLAERSLARVTETKESEYSPTFMPDGAHFSVVRVEADGTQRLWRFDLSGRNPALVLENVKPVGYHAWADETTVALFVLGTPPTLQIADTRTGKADVILQNVGRSLHKVPGRGAISFVHKASEKEWWVKLLEPGSRQVTPLVQTLPGSEDYAWTSDGALLMGQGSKLFEYKPGRDETWKEVADLALQGVGGITRLAVSPMGDRLALVGQRPGKR